MLVYLFVTLALGLLCGASDTDGCFPEGHACKMLRRHWRHPHESRIRELRLPVHENCPKFNLQSTGEISNRSISPWRYRIDVDKTRYPEEIAVAECLCSGCIINGKEETDYVSYPVMQTMMVVRKKECAEKGKYSFKTEMIQVQVACTCAMPRYLD